MTDQSQLGTEVIAAALAAISGQSLTDIESALVEARGRERRVEPRGTVDLGQLLNLIGTRLGLAAGLDHGVAESHREALREWEKASGSLVDPTEVALWAELLRGLPDHVPTLERDPLALPALPPGQSQMWSVLMDLEESEPRPWALVGGQMTFLHCLENDYTAIRPTDDGDVVVDVWTRRGALRQMATFLTHREFTEQKTSDGYGYRYSRGDTTIDLLVPEGLERQRSYPTTMSGRPGFQVAGGNQALARAERVPIARAGRVGYVRRPTLLGAIVAKAHAFVTDGRDPLRHVEDVVALADIALADPRKVLERAVSNDRRPVRRLLTAFPVGHAVFERAADPEATRALLARLAEPA